MSLAAGARCRDDLAGKALSSKRDDLDGAGLAWSSAADCFLLPNLSWNGEPRMLFNRYEASQCLFLSVNPGTYGRIGKAGARMLVILAEEDSVCGDSHVLCPNCVCELSFQFMKAYLQVRDWRPGWLGWMRHHYKCG